MKKREEKVRRKDAKMPSSEHEQVYHAASRCQGKRSGLTAHRLHDLERVCSVEGQKTGGFASKGSAPLRDAAAMEGLSRLEGGCFIPLMLVHHGENDAHPHVGQGSDRHRMAFPFRSLALIVVGGPALLLGPLPSKLLQGVTQWFDTAQPSVCFGIVATLKQDGRGKSQGLQARRIGVAALLIPDLSQQTRSKTFACSGQRAEDRVVFMRQKKALDLLIVRGDLLYQGQQLGHQCYHQARFGACGDRIGDQLRLMQGFEDLGSNLVGRRMPCVLQDLSDLLHRSVHRCLWRGVGLQEDQAGVLLQLAKQLQGARIVALPGGRELIDQAGLHLDQGILVTSEGFEFGHHLAVWGQPAQIGQIRSSRFGEQIGIHAIRFGSRGRTSAIHCARVDRIDGPSRFQQESNEQSMGGFDDTGHLLFLIRTADGFQKGVQLGESFWRVINAHRSSLVSLLVEHQGVMVRICPIDASIPHGAAPSVEFTFLSPRALILWCSKHDFLIIGSAQEQRQGSASFHNRSSRVERGDFPRRVQQFA